MIMDKNLQFSSAQAVTVTAASTDVIDQGVARDLMPGQVIQVLAQVGAQFTAAGAATLQVQFQGSSDNVTYSTYAESRAYALAELAPGARILDIDVPGRNGPAVLPRYIRLNYVVATGPMTGGTLTAGLVAERGDQVYYPPGVAIVN